MIKSLVTICLSVMCTVLTIAQSAEETFQKANQLYMDADFTEALNRYNELHENGIASADLYYNIGNCYYEINQIGHAILWYERAIRLSPHEEQIKQNLALAQKRQSDSLDEVQDMVVKTWWRQIANFFPSNTWSIFALLFLSMGLTGLYFRMYSPSLKRRIAGLSMALLGIFFFILCLLWSLERHRFIHDKSKAIIIKEKCSIYKSPEQDSDVYMQVHEGLKIEIIDEMHGRYFVKLPDGELVWLEKADVEII